MAARRRGPVLVATEKAIKAAADQLTDLDVGAVQVLRALARKIDEDDALRGAYLAWQLDREISPTKPLQLDNVSIPTYLKYCESLGLTPAGRLRLAEKPKEKPANKLAALRSVSQIKGA